MNQSTLIFVYNADSGVFNLAADIAHKIFSPQTYQCNLCRLTHGNFKIKNEWRDYLETLPVPLKFLHADEFKIEYPDYADLKLPAVFSANEKSGAKLLIDAQTINRCRTLRDLQTVINQYLNLSKA